MLVRLGKISTLGVNPIVIQLFKPSITNNLDGTFSVACPIQSNKKPIITNNQNGTYSVTCRA